MPTEATPDAQQLASGAVAPPAQRPDPVLGAFELAAAAAVGVAFLVGVVAAVRQNWTPASDDALIALHVRDVPGHLPLVGAYSRFGWSHPGPAGYYFLALPFRLFGSAPAGLMAGALLLGFGGTLWAWLVARRADRVAGALLLAGMTLVMAGRDAVDLRDPWNPYVGVLLTGTLVVVGWAAAERRAGSVFALVPLGSFLVQAHIGYLPVVASVLAAASLCAFWSFGYSSVRARPERPLPVRAGLAGLLLALAMWVPPLVQQATGDPGNLWLLRSATTGAGPVAGIGTAVRLVFAAFAVPPSWLGRDLPVLLRGVTPSWTLPLLGAVPVLATAVALARRDRQKLRAMVVCGAAVTGALVGISRITGPVHEYLFAGLGVTAAVSIALGTWVLVDAFAGARVQRYVALVSLGVVVGAAVPIAVMQTGVEGPYPSSASGVAALAPAIVEDAGEDAVFIEAVPEFTAYAAVPGLVLELEEHGLDVRVDRNSTREFGEHRTGSPDGRTRYLVAFPGMVPDYLDRGWELVGQYDPLPAEVGEEVAALDAELLELYQRRSHLQATGGDTEAVDRLVDANREESYDLRAERFPLAVLRAPQ